MRKIYIDAGTLTLKIWVKQGDNTDFFEVNSSTDLNIAFEEVDLFNKAKGSSVFITGKLKDVIYNFLHSGRLLSSEAILWSAARYKQRLMSQKESLAIVDLSASGYMIVGIDKNGELFKDCLITNPRCGAGTGFNFDRVLQKLSIESSTVDSVLRKFLGDESKDLRESLLIRHDRCGVFSSTAAISDKNQGIPIDYALAVNLKSEILKTCKKIPQNIHTVCLTGGLFKWQFARDCAQDLLNKAGIKNVLYDYAWNPYLSGMIFLEQNTTLSPLCLDSAIKKHDRIILPPFFECHELFKQAHNYLRESDLKMSLDPELLNSPLLFALDVGSTMAKVAVSDVTGEHIIYLGSYSNSGDTIETVKHIFRDLQNKINHDLKVCRVGITGSARFQVQMALINTYPELSEKVDVLVENYAHARGSIDNVFRHIHYLEKKGIKDVNKKFCLLIDIGGEDTKISVVSLNKRDLFENAMNVKCSAGTGSLMDLMADIFGIENVSDAYSMAYSAEYAYAIDAACVVFLMENARQMQAEGVGKDIILASACYAVVENMARSLWGQVEMPKNCILLLHGQTMLSDPLPLATTDRLMKYIGSPVYALIPSYPGHRACLGLLNTSSQNYLLNNEPAAQINLTQFISQQYEKKIFQCRGMICRDKDACCNRIQMTSVFSNTLTKTFTLGGCSAINDSNYFNNLQTKHFSEGYYEIWNFINKHLPTSDLPNRLVIPRSFVVSDWAYFFSTIFQSLGIPVHVDNVIEDDILEGFKYFNIDVCAPQIGAVGQFLRLCRSPHGIILAPQITLLPGKSKSLRRSCTVNQGGFAVAKGIAETIYNDSNIHLFSIDLGSEDIKKIANQFVIRLKKVFLHYGVEVSREMLEKKIEEAFSARKLLREKAVDYLCDYAEKTLSQNKPLAITIAREYILTPGVYDSHVDQFLRDKNILCIPSYLIDIKLNNDFSYIYWYNAHHIVTIVDAFSKDALHELVNNERLKLIIKRAEIKGLIGLIQISAFRCGPDSAISPLISELTKNKPHLLIQSDATTKEIAHIENRINTFEKQLDSKFQNDILQKEHSNFDFSTLTRYGNISAINKETDVIYIPTMADNRMFTSVIRSEGYTCIDNYNPDTFDLQYLVRKGREHVGDAVCTPLAAVYGDILNAIEDFNNRKRSGDQLIKGKERLLFYNFKTNGPCRQGMYVDTHRICLNRCDKCPGDNGAENKFDYFKFLIGEDDKVSSLGNTIFIKSIQGLVLNGVIQQLFLDATANCSTQEDFQNMFRDFKSLKEKLYCLQEKKLKKPANYYFDLISKFLLFNHHRVKFKKLLREFSDKWKKTDALATDVLIHVEGEVYLRIAQLEDISEALISILGLGRCHVTHSPAWNYFDYKLSSKKLRAKRTISEAKQLFLSFNFVNKKTAMMLLKKSIKKLIFSELLQFLIRRLIAAPLYRAGRVVMPEPTADMIEVGREVISTFEPGGELLPYIGETITKLRKGYSLVFNVAPEGCMVSSMGESLTSKILSRTTEHKGRIQHLFTQQGDLNKEQIYLALLKVLGPEKLYSKQYKES